MIIHHLRCSEADFVGSKLNSQLKDSERWRPAARSPVAAIRHAEVGGKNVFLGGASQGCGTALHAALTYEGELGGVIGHLAWLGVTGCDWFV
jgi:predicted esterase